MKIDAHHHLWDLQAVQYPWLLERGAVRFFGDPTPIQRNYLLDEFMADAASAGFEASVHIQVGAADAIAEAVWVQSVADANPHWRMAQVVFCDLTSADLSSHLDRLQELSTVRGVRQIVGRAPGEDAVTGTNELLDNPRFATGLGEVGARNLSFDLQLIPELMAKTAKVLEAAPDTAVVLCHAGSPHDRSVAGLGYWAQQLRSLSKLDHVSCKISGLGMFEHNWTEADFAPIVETCLDQFGPRRSMFGSNFPVDSLYSDYATLSGAIHNLVPQEMHADVFGGSAGRFYGIGAAA